MVSSWLARNALMYGMKPSQLSTLVFENTDAWKSDMDVYLRSDKLEKLSQKTGIDIEIIKKATLYSSCEYFYSQTGDTPQVKWVMPIGVGTGTGTKKEHYGLQFCSCCLAEDGNYPYFRKHWRLGFLTTCSFHSVQLHDRCPNCHSQIDLKRLQKYKSKLIYHPLNIVHCSRCGLDFRKIPIKPSSSEELEINRINFTQYLVGYGGAGDLEFQYSNLYFEGIRRLLSFLICSPKGKKLCIHLINTLRLNHLYRTEFISKHSEPELMNIHYRRVGLLLVFHLLQKWPDRFIDACRKTEVSTHQIYSPYLTFPFWITDPVCFLIRTLPPRIAEEEKQAIKKYFSSRLGRTIKDYEVPRLVMKFLA